MMKQSDVTAVVLAGGVGSRLHPLTLAEAKPALPFAKGVRLVDFVLANLVNSGVQDICVLVQYQPDSLITHLASVWAPRVESGGGRLRVLAPGMPGLQSAFLGTADAVHQALPLIAPTARGLIGVFAADHVYRMDVRQMVAFHRGREAEVSVSVLPVPIGDACAFGVVALDERRRVCGFQEKPSCPLSLPGAPHLACVSMGNYLFEAGTLDALLAETAGLGGVDFGHHVLPHAVRTRQVYAYDFAANRVPGLREHEVAAYWRDVGTLQALEAARQDVQGERPRLDLLNPHWPLHPEDMPVLQWPAPVKTDAAREPAHA
jgi:glucose-1-phosphate adenylyltransferase